MEFFIAVIITVVTLCTVSALPALIKRVSWARFFVGFVLSFFGILLPLAFFFLSALLTPDSKDNSHHGWVDCFYEGKLALTPLVLWATAALYAVEIYEVQNRNRAWIVCGFLVGAVVSSICFVFGLATARDAVVLLVVPLYTAIWYVWRTIQLVAQPEVKSTTLFAVLGGSTPFWAASAFWSYTRYLSLPQHSPDCFVVTAASRGHVNLVGPFTTVTRRGQMRSVNHQLATFWQFEALWRELSPGSHGVFRRWYNVIGSVVARNMTSPWMADAVYLALKPAEIFARCVLHAKIIEKGACSPSCALRTCGEPKPQRS